MVNESLAVMVPKVCGWAMAMPAQNVRASRTSAAGIRIDFMVIPFFFGPIGGPFWLRPSFGARRAGTPRTGGFPHQKTEEKNLSEDAQILVTIRPPLAPNLIFHGDAPHAELRGGRPDQKIRRVLAFGVTVVSSRCTVTS